MKSIDEFVNQILCGDCLEAMKEMPPNSVDMCLTSPPYWGLRDYGVEGQLGLEKTPEEYIEKMTAVFHEVKRVLKKEGTFWLVIGDTYCSDSTVRTAGIDGFLRKGDDGYDAYLASERHADKSNKKRRTFEYKNLPAKCLLMVPERLAWSLIQDGWILRNKIIWRKPNPMPSSVKDRFSNTWEYVYLFAKSQRYYFDLDAVREAYTEPLNRWGGDKLIAKGKSDWDKGTGQTTYRDRNMRPNEKGKNPGDVIEAPSETRTLGAILGTGKAVKVPGGKGWTGHPPGGEYALRKDPRWCPPEGRNPRDFWSINTQPFPEAHFAVFPEKLCERPIKAGCPEQVCKKCGKARERIVKKIDFGEEYSATRYPDKSNAGALSRKRQAYRKAGLEAPPAPKTIGWTSCNCNAGFEVGIVLDPFCGAGIALYVAKEMRRRYIGIDIKQEYVDMTKKRIAQGVL